jgi:hypothetical protein
MEYGPGMGPSVSTSAEKYTSTISDLVLAVMSGGDSISLPNRWSAIAPMLSDHINKSLGLNRGALGGCNPIVMSKNLTAMDARVPLTALNYAGISTAVLELVTDIFPFFLPQLVKPETEVN